MVRKYLSITVLLFNCWFCSWSFACTRVLLMYRAACEGHSARLDQPAIGSARRMLHTQQEWVIILSRNVIQSVSRRTFGHRSIPVPWHQLSMEANTLPELVTPDRGHRGVLLPQKKGSSSWMMPTK
jgi:hypothetical protein